MNTDLVDMYKRMPVLHYDILLHLFAMLNLKDLLRAEKVCRLWKCATAKFWERETLKIKFATTANVCEELSSEESLTLFDNVSTHLKRLAISDTHMKSCNIVYVNLQSQKYFIKKKNFDYHGIVQILVTQVKNLESLKLTSFCGADINAWRDFFSANTKLTTIKLLFTKDCPDSLFARSDLSFLPSNLEHIRIEERCDDDSHIVEFIKRQTRLKKLHASTNYVSTDLLNELKSHAHSLESLCIASKYIFCKRDDSRRDSRSMLPIAKCFKLKKLHFNQMIISDEFAIAIAENLRSLHQLKLDKILNISPQAFNTLVSIQSLEILLVEVVDFVTPDLTHLTNLKQIVLTFDLYADFDMFGAVDTVFDELPFLPVIPQVRLERSKKPSFCIQRLHKLVNKIIRLGYKIVISTIDKLYDSSKIRIYSHDRGFLNEFHILLDPITLHEAITLLSPES